MTQYSEPNAALEDPTFERNRFMEAMLVGFLSSVSLIMGSAIGLKWPPRHQVTGMLAAFGGGALLAALAVELMAPVAEEVTSVHTPPDKVTDAKNNLVVTLLCAVLGGGLFIVLDQLVNRHGGFIAGYYTTVHYYAKRKQHRARILSSLRASPIFANVPNEELEYTMLFCRPCHFHAGDQLFQRGEVAEKMYFIEGGRIELFRTLLAHGHSVFVGQGGLLGEVGVLNGNFIGTAIARSQVDAYWISKGHILMLIEECPSFAQVIRSYCVSKLEHIVRIEQQNLHDLNMATSSSRRSLQVSGSFAQLAASGDTSEAEMVPCNSLDHLVDLEVEEGTQPHAQPNTAACTPMRHPVASPVVGQSPAHPEEVWQVMANVEASFKGSKPRGFSMRADMESEMSDHRARISHEHEVPVSPFHRSSTDTQSSQRKSFEITHIELNKLRAQGSGSRTTSEDRDPRLSWQRISERSEGGNPFTGVSVSYDALLGTLHKAEEPANACVDSGFLMEGSSRKSAEKCTPSSADESTLRNAENSTLEMGESQGIQASVAPLAVWLGILLDGIPESIVIGTQYAKQLGLPGKDQASVAELIPYTLIAGLFLSNFPEALASSVSMHQYGWSRLRVLCMWGSLTLFTSLGAGLGYAVGNSWSKTLVVGVQGLAAGAMLTMIASAMIPEALHTCGPNQTGCSVLLGFVVAIAFKLLE